MRLRQAMLSSALQQNATLLLFFGTGVVIAHLLSPREVGSYSVAIAAAGMFAALKDSAVASYVVSAPELDDRLLGAAFGLSLTIAACLTVGFVGLSFPLATFYQDPTVGVALRIVALAQLGPALAFPATIRLVRAMQFGSLLAIGLAAAVSQSVVSLTLAMLGHGGAALAWGYFASSVVMAVMTMIYQPDAIQLRPTLQGAGQLLAFAGWMSATLFVGSTTTSTPELAIGRVLGIANAALFSRAQNLVSFVRNGLLFGLTKPLLSDFGRRERERESLAPIYLRIVELVTGLSWPAYGVLAIWAEPLVRTIYGEAWSAAGTMMTPIAIAHGLALTVPLHYDILIIKRRPRLLFASELSMFLFTILALGIGLMIGIESAVWSLVFSSAFFATYYFIVLKAIIDFASGALVKVWSRSLTLTLVAIPVPLIFRHLAGHGAAEVLLGFAGSSAVAALIWIAGVMFTRHELSLHIGPLLESGFASVARRRPRRSGSQERPIGVELPVTDRSR